MKNASVALTLTLTATLTLTISACAELPEIPAGECGNRVHEPDLGEECDGVAGCGTADGAHGCGWVCDVEACPTGYRCGADDRCRLPTETFIATAAQPMATSAVSVADMDGDGAFDLLGYDSRGLVMRFGDWEGTLAAETRVPLPLAGLASCTADVDGNGMRDVALPIGDIGFGLLISDGARGLTPVAQSAIAFEGDGCEEIVAGNVHSNPDAEPRMVLAFGGYSLGFLDDATSCEGQLDCVVSATGGAVVGGRLAAAHLGYGLAAGVHPGQQFTLGVVGQAAISVWGESTLALRPKRVGTWVLPEAFRDDGHVAFAQLDGDGCFDLLVDTGVSLHTSYSTSIPLGGGGFLCTGLSPTLTVTTRPDGPIVGIGDVDGDGRDELLVSLVDDASAAWVIVTYAPNGTPGQWDARGLFLSAEEPRAGVVLDYDRDGLNDLALIFVGATTVDFYLNYLGFGYSRFPVDVGGEPRAPQVGDFDGDLHADVVVAVPDTSNPEGREDVMLLYGDPSGRPVGPQFVGSFVAEARPVRFQGGIQPFSDSVLVVSNYLPDDGVACDRRLAVLIGDTSRQLVSPYVLTYLDPVDGLEAVTPLGIADLSVPGGPPRTLAVGTVVEGDGSSSTVLSVLGFVDGEFTVEPGLAIEVPAANLPRSHFEQARWKAGDLDNDGVAEAVAISGSKAAVIHLDGSISAELFDLEDEMAFPPAITLIDADGDGDLDLVGAGGAAISSNDGDVGAAAVFWMAPNEDGELAFNDGVVLAMPSDMYCYDAAMIHSSPTGVPQLAGLCYVPEADTFRLAVVIGSYDPARSTDEVVDLRMIPIEGAPGQLEVADLTGDGLDDLALFTDNAVTIYRQCRADEVCLAVAEL